MGDSSLNIITRTPAEGTYESSTVRSLWDLSRSVANAALAVIVMWGGFNVVLKQHTRSPYDGVMEQERVFVYDASWRIIEERVDFDHDTAPGTDWVSQHFWGLRYIDDLVAKRVDRDAERIEHVLEPEMIYQLERLLRQSPGGSKVPGSPHRLESAVP